MSARAPALLTSLLLALASSACSTTYFVVQRRAPAEVNLPAGLPMAVAKIAGEEGEALASELTQALVRTQRFQVLERSYGAKYPGEIGHAVRALAIELLERLAATEAASTAAAAPVADTAALDAAS